MEQLGFRRFGRVRAALMCGYVLVGCDIQGQADTWYGAPHISGSGASGSDAERSRKDPNISEDATLPADAPPSPWATPRRHLGSNQDAADLSQIGLPTGRRRATGLILITVDTLRADYLSSYGHTRVLTPTFDRLASGGVLFRRAMAQSTTTTPSHASLLTSLYLQDHNVYSNFEKLGSAPKTMAEILAKRGFATFAIANMKHLNPEIGGLGQGFDTFVKSGFFRRAGPSVEIFLRWLDRHRDENPEQPFFAWIHLADVHTPYRPPEPYNHFYYDGDQSDPNKKSLARVWPLLPSHMSDHPFFKKWLEGITDLDWVTAQYQGAVTYVDDQIGHLLDALEHRDILRQTAVVFTADHGESLGEHDLYFVHAGLYETTARVPLITYFPGSKRQGIEVREVVELVDVLPTVLDYFNISPPHRIRGESLWPLIRGEMQPSKIAMIEHAGDNQVALRSERYKYIRHLRDLHVLPAYPFVDGREELYDLKADPAERFNIANKEPQLIARFRNLLLERRSKRLAIETGEAELSEETVDVLRALGYVEN